MRAGPIRLIPALITSPPPKLTSCSRMSLSPERSAVKVQPMLVSSLGENLAANEEAEVNHGHTEGPPPRPPARQGLRPRPGAPGGQSGNLK